MSLLRRTFITLRGRVDQIVGDIENHDALIAAAIKEQRHKIAAARAELIRIKRREQALEEQLQRLAHNQALWSQRAINEAADDEDRALLCLQQRERLAEQADKLSATRQRYRGTAEKMQQDIERSEAKLQELTRKHDLLKARQSSTEALHSMSHLGSDGLEELETCFDRWETKLAQSEYHVDAELSDSGSIDGDSVDLEVASLERDYLQQEKRQQLRAELAALLQEGRSDG